MVQNGYSMEGLMTIVAKLAGQYMCGESSSISYERAQMLMEAVIYCVKEYESADNDKLSGGFWLEEAYRGGSQLVVEKVMKLKDRYHQMLPSFRDYGMICLYTEGMM